MKPCTKLNFSVWAISIPDKTSQSSIPSEWAKTISKILDTCNRNKNPLNKMASKTITTCFSVLNIKTKVNSPLTCSFLKVSVNCLILSTAFLPMLVSNPKKTQFTKCGLTCKRTLKSGECVDTWVLNYKIPQMNSVTEMMATINNNWVVWRLNSTGSSQYKEPNNSSTILRTCLTKPLNRPLGTSMCCQVPFQDTALRRWKVSVTRARKRTIAITKVLSPNVIHTIRSSAVNSKRVRL
jgi:hypothetical protein